MVMKPPYGTTKLNTNYALNKKLCVYYLLNEGTGIAEGTPIHDATGNSYNTAGMYGFSDPLPLVSGWKAAGRNGISLMFDGVNDGIDLGAMDQDVLLPETSFDPLSTISIAVWVKFTGGPLDVAERYVIGNNNEDGSSNSMSLAGSNGAYRFETNSGSRSVIKTGLIYNTWTHLVAIRVVSGTNELLKLYINGILVGTNTYTSLSTIPNRWSFGRMLSAFHLGEIDEIRIWSNKELFQSEVSELYNNGLAGLYPEFAPMGLVGSVNIITNPPGAAVTIDGVLR
jgi:hypothetical protein